MVAVLTGAYRVGVGEKWKGRSRKTFWVVIAVIQVGVDGVSDQDDGSGTSEN